MTITLDRETVTESALEQAHAQLVDAVGSLVEGDDWQAMLSFAGQFHKYSPTNLLLIMIQNPDATHVAGYKKWIELGRQVRKGERGIRILAPIVVKKPDQEQPDQEPRARVVGFRTTSVFDVSQTDGEDLPDDCKPELLTGDETADLYGSLAKHLADLGWSLERGDCGRANGVTIHDERRVIVRTDLELAQAAKTLAHEVAHVLMHETDRECRGVIEVEAESVAYLVTQACGLNSGAYTFPYVAGWSGGDVETVQRTAERVITTARKILVELVTP